MSGYDASAGGHRSPWKSGQARQADSLLDDLFDDLEHSFDEGLGEVEEYPYFGTRPPLRSRRSQSSGGMLLGMALAATFVAGLAFWMTLRPRAVVFSTSREFRGELPFLEKESDPSEGDPLLATPTSLLEQASDSSFTMTNPQEDSPKVPEGNAAAPKDSVPLAPTGTAAIAAEPAPARAASPAVSAPSVPAAPPVPPAPVRIPPQPVPQMKLVGLIHDPGAPKALILIDNVVRQVPVGHPVKAEWRVTSISPYGVAVSNGAQSFTLQLGLTQRI
ncbi:hypothetical protein [Thermostichus vulcanus]|uniref:Uncharacterized protein n=1 Tax=Thermostichus vulcanus str. 'Rupite' TaxID=2813851 RepID=A0ABT0C7Q0_THEVL|nr:hypothetical protein [Thermostichus vulcanus]MCJ2541821.1 hypothetical protein [Thermostichus vulcanus str. 'Rupite']